MAGAFGHAVPLLSAQSLAACAPAEQVGGRALSGRCALARRRSSASGVLHVMLGCEFAAAERMSRAAWR